MYGFLLCQWNTQLGRSFINDYTARSAVKLTYNLKLQTRRRGRQSHIQSLD